MTKPAYKSLSDCVRSLSGGTPSKSNDSFWSGDLPWVSSGEMVQSRITDTELHITQEAGENHSKIVPAGTVLVVVRGMSLAKEFRVSITQKEMAFNQDLKALIAKENVNSLFLFYSLYGRRFEICKLASESAHGTKKLDTKVLDSIPVFLPAIPTQKKIAAIVSAYDDLIENNDRRIALIEKMAEEIYREWFVRLRFPGHEQATFHKGIPEGWEIKDLKDADISILDGDRGSNYPSKDEFSESGYCLFLSTGNIKDDKFDFSNNDFITEQKDSILRKGKLVFNDIILTTRGTVGNIAFYSKNLAYQNVRINSGMVIFRPKNGEDEALYYYYLLKSSLLKDQYRSYSSGSAQPQLPIKDLRRINILIPPKEITKRFCNLVGILNDRLDLLELVNWNLKQTRDRLLTRLISGKLSVEDLDIQFPSSMTTDS